MTLYIIAAIIILIIFIGAKKMGMQGVNQVDADQAKKMTEDPSTIILDVRNPDEFKSGHLKNARLIPVSELSQRISDLDSVKGKSLLVYCHAGSRSSAACQILKQNGFANLSNLSGGITAWNGKGYKTV